MDPSPCTPPHQELWKDTKNTFKSFRRTSRALEGHQELWKDTKNTFESFGRIPTTRSRALEGHQQHDRELWKDTNNTI
jgi:hypothetical protein